MKQKQQDCKQPCKLSAVDLLHVPIDLALYETLEMNICVEEMLETDENCELFRCKQANQMWMSYDFLVGSEHGGN